MKAYVIDGSARGGILLSDQPEPSPKADEALLSVEAISLNRGEIPSHGMFPAGAVPGWDSAGRIVKAAEDGSGPKEGTSVVGFAHGGAWAELRALPTSRIAALPEGIDVEQASTLPVAAGTALRAIRLLGPILGKPVLVTGASGGVGQFAVQLAKLGGAHVVALASSPSKVDELRRLGADEVVTDAGASSVPYFGVIENVGGKVLVDAWQRMRTGGTLVSIGYAAGEPAVFPPYGTVGPRKTLVSFYLGDEGVGDSPISEDLAYLAGLVATGKLDARIVWRGGWEQLPDAIELLDSRRISGKAVVRVA